MIFKNYKGEQQIAKIQLEGGKQIKTKNNHEKNGIFKRNSL